MIDTSKVVIVVATAIIAIIVVLAITVANSPYQGTHPFDVSHSPVSV